jgi:uncharacterized membrane protein YoaK (UPF0700 family)
MLDNSRNILLTSAPSALAGYVDGIGFLHLGGLFVSFMSGNSTRMGVSLAEAEWRQVAEALGLIVLFVVGAAGGSLKGGPRWAWAPNLLLGAALVAGSAAGAFAYHRFNLAAIWFAAGLALLLSAWLVVTVRPTHS